MLLQKVKKALQDIGYNRINKIQEKLNQYGSMLQELEIDLVNLHKSPKSLLQKINEELQINTEIENVRSRIEEEREKIEKIEEKIEKIGKAKNFQELNIRNTDIIKRLIQEEQIILTLSDINTDCGNQDKKIPYIVFGFNNISDDVLSHIYTGSKKVQEFNINSIKGIQDNKYIILIPIYEIPKENILEKTSENRLRIKRFYSLKKAIIICSEKDLSNISNKDIEKIGVQDGSSLDYVKTVLAILGENLEENSTDLKEFDLYKYYESKQSQKRSLRKGENIRNRCFRKVSKTEKENTRKEAINLFSKIIEICNENGEFTASDNIYGKIARVYTNTVYNWNELHNKFNYTIQLDSKSYKIRPEITENNFPIESGEENNSIYNAAKITYTVNRLAHSYRKQIELIIRNNFNVKDNNQIEETKEIINRAYENKERGKESEYQEDISRLRTIGGNLLQKNQVEKYVKIVGRKFELEREAFYCKNTLIYYIANRISGLPTNKRKNYVCGHITNEKETTLVLDIPMYEQLRVHVTSKKQKVKLQSQLPRYPLDLITMNRGNILSKGLNQKLEQRLKEVGDKRQMEEFIRENMSMQQAHEVFLLMGYQGEDLINAINCKKKEIEIVV